MQHDLPNSLLADPKLAGDDSQALSTRLTIEPKPGRDHEPFSLRQAGQELNHFVRPLAVEPGIVVSIASFLCEAVEPQLVVSDRPLGQLTTSFQESPHVIPHGPCRVSTESISQTDIKQLD